MFSIPTFSIVVVAVSLWAFFGALGFVIHLELVKRSYFDNASVARLLFYILFSGPAVWFCTFVVFLAGIYRIFTHWILQVGPEKSPFLKSKTVQEKESQNG